MPPPTQPPWFTALKWSAPATLEQVRVLRASIPQKPGLYCFTNYAGPLERNFGVLYVGKAGKSIQSRVGSYLVNPAEMMILGRTGNVSKSLKHAGKTQLLMEVMKRPRGIWVRWTEMLNPEPTERLLISFLRPAYNTSLNSPSEAED